MRESYIYVQCRWNQIENVREDDKTNFTMMKVIFYCRFDECFWKQEKHLRGDKVYIEIIVSFLFYTLRINKSTKSFY